MAAALEMGSLLKPATFAAVLLLCYGPCGIASVCDIGRQLAPLDTDAVEQSRRHLLDNICYEEREVCLEFTIRPPFICVKYHTVSFTVPCPCPAGVRCDPIITAFNGKEFHFNEVGRFTLLEDGDGWKVEVTFTGETVLEGEGAGEIKEKSWTSGVSIIAPNGDIVSINLPAIKPNSTKLQMTAKAGNATDHKLLSPNNTYIAFDQMSATAVLSEGPEQDVWACIVGMTKMEITVFQMWGWKQAQIDPEMESWAIPFTWLNTDVKVLKPLAAPVTGILGDTYPAAAATAQTSLYPDAETSVVASIVGANHGRSLAGFEDDVFLSAGVVGLAPKSSD